MARKFRLDQVLTEVRDLIAADLPAMITAAGLLDLKSVGLGEPTWVGDDEFPTVRVNGHATSQGRIAGRSLEPGYVLEIYAAYKQRRTDEAIEDGCQLAHMCLQILLDHDCHEVGGVNIWRKTIRGSELIRPIHDEEGGWQGGMLNIRLVGDNFTWT